MLKMLINYRQDLRYLSMFHLKEKLKSQYWRYAPGNCLIGRGPTKVVPDTHRQSEIKIRCKYIWIIQDTNGKSKLLRLII